MFHVKLGLPGYDKYRQCRANKSKPYNDNRVSKRNLERTRHNICAGISVHNNMSAGISLQDNNSACWNMCAE